MIYKERLEAGIVFDFFLCSRYFKYQFGVLYNA